MSDHLSNNVRLFIACEIPTEAQNGLEEVITQLKGFAGDSVRWVKPSGVHVTLKFLGEVQQKKLPAIKMALGEAVMRHSPFTLEFSTLGIFGGREGLRIMWVGVAGDVLRLEALVRDVNLALGVVGFDPDRRPFRPHLTLGRVRDEVSTRRRAEIEVETGKVDVPGITWRTSQISLMRSRLTPEGAMYDVVATFPLRMAHTLA